MHVHARRNVFAAKLAQPLSSKLPIIADRSSAISSGSEATLAMLLIARTLRTNGPPSMRGTSVSARLLDSRERCPSGLRSTLGKRV
jgi:hypothetical protein